MIKVIRKINIEEEITPGYTAVSGVEPRHEEVTIDGVRSIIFLDSIKPLTKITYDRNGVPTATIQTSETTWEPTNIVDLGTQFDHRVSFLTFDLDQLEWNLMHDLNKRYNHYSFYLGITDPYGETSTWEFDGMMFEIPRKVTKEPGLYTFTLIVEEYTGDAYPGNIKQESPFYVERFVAKSFKGNVSPTGYRPEYDITLFDIETDQKASLTKPSINCTLADNGVLTLSSNSLGEKLDNFVTYFAFNPGDITSHLNLFTLFMTFKQGSRFCCSLFEKTNKDDDRDITTHPLVAWVPSEVYQNPGDWTVSVIGFLGRDDHINDPNEFNGDYYFYVSKEAQVHVNDSVLQQADLDRETILSVTLNLLTKNSQGIATADDSYYVLGEEANND